MSLRSPLDKKILKNTSQHTAFPSYSTSLNFPSIHLKSLNSTKGNSPSESSSPFPSAYAAHPVKGRFASALDLFACFGLRSLRCWLRGEFFPPLSPRRGAGGASFLLLALASQSARVSLETGKCALPGFCFSLRTTSVPMYKCALRYFLRVLSTSKRSLPKCALLAFSSSRTGRVQHNPRRSRFACRWNQAEISPGAAFVSGVQRRRKKEQGQKRSVPCSFLRRSDNEA